MKKISEQEKFYGTMNKILEFIGYIILLIIGWWLMGGLFPDFIFGLAIPPLLLIILYYTKHKKL